MCRLGGVNVSMWHFGSAASTTTAAHAECIHSVGMVIKRVKAWRMELSTPCKGSWELCYFQLWKYKYITPLSDELAGEPQHFTPLEAGCFPYLLRPIFLISPHFTDTLVTWADQTLIPEGIQQNRKSALISLLEFEAELERTVTQTIKVLTSSLWQSDRNPLVFSFFFFFLQVIRRRKQKSASPCSGWMTLERDWKHLPLMNWS